MKPAEIIQATLHKNGLDEKLANTIATETMNQLRHTKGAQVKGADMVTCLGRILADHHDELEACKQSNLKLIEACYDALRHAVKGKKK